MMTSQRAMWVVVVVALAGSIAQADSNDCGQAVPKADGGPFKVIQLTSPNYPQDYDNDQSCQWTVGPGGPSGKVYLTFEDFEIHESDEFIIKNTDGDQLARFTGIFKFEGPNAETYPKEKYMEFPASKDLVIIFNSDSQNTSTGFRLKISWSACPRACSEGSGGTALVSDSTGRQQCVCQGCAAVNCPLFCAYGKSVFQKPGQDCKKCFCKAPTCSARGCRMGHVASSKDNNDNYYCKCRDPTFDGTDFAVQRYGIGMSTYTFPRVRVNGQTRFLCTPHFDMAVQPPPVVQGMSNAICEREGFRREDKKNFIMPIRSFLFYKIRELDTLTKGDLAWVINMDCTFPAGSNSTQDYAPCIQPQPTPMSNCVGENAKYKLMSIWCIT